MFITIRNWIAVPSFALGIFLALWLFFITHARVNDWNNRLAAALKLLASALGQDQGNGAPSAESSASPQVVIRALGEARKARINLAFTKVLCIFCLVICSICCLLLAVCAHFLWSSFFSAP